ncbi:MAG: hypothetical protein NT007_18090 [Candidatus Kapabacteria bacterium]|nr:hypothetical protein [Candidatus Kapabacteria bacterium]
MSWNHIIGHKRVKKIIQRSFLEERIAGAYCFWGIDGIGKEAVAIEFAKLLNCSNPIRNEQKINACDECSNCKKISTLTHPNLQLIFSLPAGKGTDSKGDSPYSKLSDEQITEIQNEIQTKAKDHYYKINIQNANQIKIASIRELKRKLTLSAQTDGRTVIIIFNAEELTGESANAFLKTLEEPQDNVTIILVTSRHETIIPTILSRCQQIKFEPLDNQSIEEALISRNKLGQEEARLISAFAQGSYHKATEYLDEDMKQLRFDIVDLLRSCLKRNFRVELINKIDTFLKNKDKRRIEYSLNLLLLWLRDVYTVRSLNNTENIINIDQVSTISKFTNAYLNADIENSVNVIEKTISGLRHNALIQLSLINLFINLREYIMR